VGRAAAIAGAIAILAGGAAIAYAVTRKPAVGMSETQSVAMATAVGNLDSEIRAKRAEVHGRATTLSELPLLRRAIGTDSKTMNDLVNGEKGGELGLLDKDKRNADNEIIEIGGVNRETKAPELWLLQPKGAPRKSHDGVPGVYVDLVGSEITITEVAKVVPENPSDPSGYISITRRLAVDPMLQPLVDAGISGRLVINGMDAAIGRIPDGATTREQPLAAAEGAKLIVAEPPPHAVLPMPFLVGGIGGAIIGLLLLAIGVLGKRDAAYSRAFTAAQSAQLPPASATPVMTASSPTTASPPPARRPPSTPAQARRSSPPTSERAP
jgi:hypothetical protein